MLPFTQEQFLAVLFAYNEAVWTTSGVLASAQTTRMFGTIFDSQAVRQAGHVGIETLRRRHNEQELV